MGAAIVPQSHFEEVRRLLHEQGFAIEIARYYPTDFGSWVVSVVRAPALRIVWDGKDRWLTVQRQTSGVSNDSPIWEDTWIAKEPSLQTPAKAVAMRQAHA